MVLWRRLDGLTLISSLALFGVSREALFVAARFYRFECWSLSMIRAVHDRDA